MNQFFRPPLVDTRARVARLALLACLALGCGGATQSAECAKWVACSDALPGSVKGSQDRTFGPEGTCWSTSSAAATCTQSCEAATLQRAMAANAPPECK